MKKNLVMFTSVFASLAILSTGFAAWVISGGDTNEEKIGDIIVDKVEDHRHIIQKVECVDTANEGKIIFGHPETATEGWLKNNDTKTVEKLVTVFKVTVSNAASATVESIFDQTESGCSVTVSENATNFKTAVTTKQYVGELPAVKFVSSATAIDGAANLAEDGSIFVRLEFKWGSKFTKDEKVVNPYTYYNSFTAKEKGDEANTVLGEINTLLTGTKFKLKLVTKA